MFTFSILFHFLKESKERWGFQRGKAVIEMKTFFYLFRFCFFLSLSLSVTHTHTHTHTHTIFLHHILLVIWQFLKFLDVNICFPLSLSSVQFSSIAQLCPTLCYPMNCSTPGLPVHHQLPEFTQTHVHWVSDAIQLSHPLSSPSPPALNLSQHQGIFKWVSSLQNESTLHWLWGSHIVT